MGDLDHGACRTAGPDPPRRDRTVAADYPAVAVQPVEVEREAHAEGVDRAGAGEEEALAGRERAEEREAEEAGLRGGGDAEVYPGEGRGRRWKAGQALGQGRHMGIEGVDRAASPLRSTQFRGPC
jgi:hypothetical protein